MKERLKLIFINIIFGGFFLGTAFFITFLYDVIFSREIQLSKPKLTPTHKYKDLLEVIQSEDFPNKISASHVLNDYGTFHYGLKEDIFPINGRSNIKTYTCNEQGYLASFISDRYGFNNPDTVYDKEYIDIALIGDSYLEGDCTDQSTIRNILDNLTNNKLSIASIAKGGSGPLLQLAYLKEYVSFHKPKKIFWFWVGNDLRNLQDELQSPLRKYMVTGFTQNLKEKKNKFKADNIIRDYLLWVKDKRKNEEINTELDYKNNIAERFPKTYFLYYAIKKSIPKFYFDNKSYYLRKKFITRDSYLIRNLPPEEEKFMGAVAHQVMQEVNNLVKSWGETEVTLIYLGWGGLKY